MKDELPVHRQPRGSVGRRTMLAAPAALLLAAGLGRPARAQAPLRKINFGIGTQVINVAYPMANMPLALGWYKQDGLDVNVVAIAGGLQAIQLLQAGTMQFAMMNSSTVVQANVMNDVPVRAISTNGVVDWALVTLDDSPITEPQQFKGKTIGVLSLATGGIAFLNSYLKSVGLDMATDVRLVAIGAGAPALEALRTNRVQGLMYWGSMLATFENMGAKLRYFRDKDWLTYPDFCMVTLQSTIDHDLPVVEAMARNAARATLFSITGPDCVRQLQWQHWPGTKPSGAPDEATAVRWDLNSLHAQNFAMQSAMDATGGKLWGRTAADGFGRMQDLLFATKVIDKKLPPETFVIQVPGFAERTNEFDHAATLALARSCRV
jgi:NitT/TauT family transport system substrate-binding protein